MASTSGRGTGSSSTSTTGRPRPACPTRWSSTRPTPRCQRFSSTTTITCLPPANNNFHQHFPIFPFCPTISPGFSRIFLFAQHFPIFAAFSHLPFPFSYFPFPKRIQYKVYGKRQRWANMGKMGKKGKMGKTPFSLFPDSFIYLFLIIQLFIYFYIYLFVLYFGFPTFFPIFPP
jgi:hypothetical protein